MAATTPAGQPSSSAMTRRASARCRCALSACTCPKSSSASVPSSYIDSTHASSGNAEHTLHLANVQQCERAMLSGRKITRPPDQATRCTLRQRSLPRRAQRLRMAKVQQRERAVILNRPHSARRPD